MAEASKPAAGDRGSTRPGSNNPEPTGKDDDSLWEQLKARGGDGGGDGGEDASSAWTLDRILATLATVLVPLGVVAIGLAWYGAANTPFLFEQIPYMISGGLLGLGLLTAGGLLYVGTWIARLAEEQRDQSDRLREVLEGLREDLGGGGATEDANAGTTFVATPTGSMFHRRDCSIVADRNDLHTVNGQAPDLQPCKMCDPLEYRSTVA